MAAINPKRGEIWQVNFDRTRGHEIHEPHPALVINVQDAGRLNLRMVVPITTGNPGFLKHFWMVGIRPNERNGLTHDSFLDTFQLKSVALERFKYKRGNIRSQKLLNEILAAITLCIGYKPPSQRN